MCYPKGAHSLGHRWGTAPRKKGISIFQCATPRGLIRWVTVGAPPHERRVFQFFNVLPQGGSFVGSPLGHRPTKEGYFNFSMCYPKGAHSLGHRWGTAPRKKGISIFQCATPR